MNKTIKALLLFNFIILGSFSEALCASSGVAVAEVALPAITNMACQVGSKVSTDVGTKVSKQVGATFLAKLGNASSKVSEDVSKKLAKDLAERLDATAAKTIKDITKKLGDEVFDKLSKEFEQKLKSDVASSGFVDDVVDRLSKQLLSPVTPAVQPLAQTSAPQSSTAFSISKPLFVATAFGTMGYAMYYFYKRVNGMELVQKDVKCLLGSVNLEYHIAPEGFNFSSYRNKVNINDDVVFPCAHSIYVNAGFITDNNVTVPEFFNKSGDVLTKSKFIETIYRDIVLGKIAVFRGRQKVMLENENGRPKASALEEVSKALKIESRLIDSYIKRVFESTGRAQKNKKVFKVDQILFDICNNFKNRLGIPFYKVDFMQTTGKSQDSSDINLHEHLRIFNKEHLDEIRGLFLTAITKELFVEPTYEVKKLYEHIYVAPTFLAKKMCGTVWNKYYAVYNDLFELYFDLVIAKSRLNAMSRLLDLHVTHRNSSSGSGSGSILAMMGSNKPAVSKAGVLNSFESIINTLEDKSAAENNYANFDIAPVVSKIGQLEVMVKSYLDSKTNKTGIDTITNPIIQCQAELKTGPLATAVPAVIRKLRKVRTIVEDNF